jgi:hypothetical protein
MRGAIPPLPNMPPWRGARLEKSTGTTLLYFYHSKVTMNRYQHEDQQSEQLIQKPHPTRVRHETTIQLLPQNVICVNFPNQWSY